MWTRGGRLYNKLSNFHVIRVKENKDLLRPLSASVFNFHGQSTSVISRCSWREKFIYPSIYSDVSIPNVSLTEFIFDSQEKFADKIGLVNGETNQKMSHGEIRNNTMKLASALSRLGVAKNDTVAIISPNCPEFVVAFLAIAHIGAIVTTCNTSYTNSEMNHQLTDSDSTFIIAHEDVLSRVREACKDNKAIKRILSIGKESNGILSLQKLIKEDDGKGIPNNIQINPHEDVVALPYSSGTTGLSKGVMLTHRNMVANISQVLHPDLQLIQFASDDFQERYVGLIPFYHIYGMVVCSCLTLVAGAQIVTMKNFNISDFISTIRLHQPTTLHLVPPLMSVLTVSENAEPELLRNTSSILCGAAPIGITMLKDFLNKFGHHLTFVEGYGMTEASPGTHISRKDKFILGSCGPGLPNTWTKIIDIESGKTLPPGNEGEICVKGPQVMKGYHNNEEATRKTIDEEGWLHTGDIARMDEDENVYIVDRLKELIKVKAFQVAPAELENLLRLHPSIEDVAVTSIPDDRSGELPRAFVVPVLGQKITEEEIKEFISSKVARHKRLDGGVIFVKEIPKSASGKILRRVLKQMKV